MSPRRTEIVLTTACASALVALALIVWSLFDPGPFQVVAAMSIGQAIGTLSFAAFAYVAISDIRGKLATRAPIRRDSSSKLNEAARRRRSWHRTRRGRRARS